jgi:hypothetical protein
VIGVTFHRRCSVTPPCRVEGGFLRHRPWARTTRLGAGRRFTRIGSPVWKSGGPSHDKVQDRTKRRKAACSPRLH